MSKSSGILLHYLLPGQGLGGESGTSSTLEIIVYGLAGIFSEWKQLSGCCSLCRRDGLDTGRPRIGRVQRANLCLTMPLGVLSGHG